MALDVVDVHASDACVVQELERCRIARELHDGVVQSLTALVADLEYFRMEYPAPHQGNRREIAERLDVWQALARNSLVSIRQTLAGLRPLDEAVCNLKVTVRKMLAELQDAGYTVVYECTSWPSVLAWEWATSLYYVIREALMNICKHAYASKIRVCMCRHAEQLHIAIEDNGVGMAMPSSMAATENGDHLGLVGMRERIALLGGQLAIESVQGRGTRLQAVLPLP